MNFYYTIVEDNKIDIHENEADAILNSTVTYGSGFFISNKGEIATNNHVIYPSIDFDEIDEAFEYHIEELEFAILNEINNSEQLNKNLSSYYSEFFDYLSYQQRRDIYHEFIDREDRIELLYSLLDDLDYNESKNKHEIIFVNMGVALENTHVERVKDFIECVPLKKAESGLDLAIVQLKTKQTPDLVKKIVSLESLSSQSELELDQEIAMIGFNAGIYLANTEDGIIAQLTTGNVTQETTTDNVLYSIPTLTGSSGSPVFNLYGELVAVNYAKVSEFQGFSFGIPAIHLSDLYFKEESNSSIENTYKYTSIESWSKTEEEVDYSDKIESFIEAEDSRDFSDIYKHFSPDLERYWDVPDPSYAVLKSQYENAWAATSYSSNSIIEIERLSETYYLLETNFSFKKKSTGTITTVTSTVAFEFNEEGKIVKTYGLN